MRQVTLTLPGNNSITGLELDFEIGKEQWNEYNLLDGGRIRMKSTILRFIHIIDPATGQLKYLENGEPELFIQANNQVVVSK
jgi:hypothetical protein